MSAADNKAVFLSYASQDAAAVSRIAEALRGAGVEVWFDQNELTGGDAWDQKIRSQIKSCALFVPVISAATNARREGYFRREWKLAVDRTHDMDEALPFLLPVVIDATTDAGAFVPEKFREVQWTRLSGGETPDKFCARVKKLLEVSIVGPVVDRAPGQRPGRPSTARRSRWWVGPKILGVAACVALVIWQPWRSKTPPVASSAPTSVAVPASESRQLVAKIWEQLNKAELGRAELEAADDLGKRATTLDPNAADAWAAWSQVDSWTLYHNFVNNTGRRAFAHAKAARALQLAPRSYEARLAQACYLVRGGGGDLAVSAYAGQAQEMLAALLQEKPGEPRALLTLAILQRNTGQIDAMRTSLGQLAQNPRFAALAWNELGWAEYSLRRFAVAVDAADRSIALQPYWANLLMKMQLALWWSADQAKAKATFEQSLAAGVQEDFSIADGCWLYLALREPESVLKLLASAPHDWLYSNIFEGPADYFAGKAHAAAGRANAAHVHWQTALMLVESRLKETPNSALLLRWKARLQGLTGNRAEGRTTMQVAQELEANTPGGFMGERTTAEDQVGLGQIDDALRTIETGVTKGSLTWAQLTLDPEFDPLRSDARFQALVARAAADPRLSPHAKSFGAVSDPKSVAVLAFDNRSDDKDAEYFSDGISEELINALGRVPGLTVKGRTSAFFFKGRTRPRRKSRKNSASPISCAGACARRVAKSGSPRNSAAPRRAGRSSESLTVAERAVAVQSDSTRALMAKSRALLALGRADEAVAVVRGLAADRGLTADTDTGVQAMIEVLAAVGRQAEAEALLSRVKLDSRFFALAALSRRADSVAASDAQRLSAIRWTDFLFEPSCDLIRDDPRVVQGIAALGLTDAHARVQAWRAAHPAEKVTAKERRRLTAQCLVRRQSC